MFTIIRQTDDISFKLLGLVPVLSGAGVFTLVIQDLGWAITTPLSIIGISESFWKLMKKAIMDFMNI